MYLKEVTIKNFRCLKDVTTPLKKDITLIMGINDSGKSAFLHALNFFFQKSSRLPKPDLNDFHIDSQGQRANEIEIFCTLIDDEENIVQLKKVWKIENSNEVSNAKWYVMKKDYPNETFREIEKELNKSRPRRELLKNFAINNNIISSEDVLRVHSKDLQELIKRFLNKQNKEMIWCEIKQNDELIINLPDFEFYDSNQFENPEEYLKKITTNTAKEIMNDTEFKNIVDAFKHKYEEKLKTHIKDLYKFIKKYNKRIRNEKIVLEIDPLKALQAYRIELDDGRGFHPVSKKGEGIRKMLFLAITDWDKSKSKSRYLIRGYDEPDNSLHYDAQRSFLDILRNQPNLQVIIATHSIIFADKIPLFNIVIFSLNKEGITKVEFLEETQDETLRSFVEDLGTHIGISAKDLFFEKVILIVEGKTEYYYITIIYKFLHNGNSLESDGIVLINLEGNGAADQFLKLVKYKKEKLFILLDNEVSQNKRVTPKKLKSLGYSEEFINSRIFLIGTKEFEDALDPEFIALVLNKSYPKAKGDWSKKEIQNLRNSCLQNDLKFSKELENLVKRETRNHKLFKKAEFGLYLAKNTSREEQIPQVVKNLFDSIDEYVNS